MDEKFPREKSGEDSHKGVQVAKIGNPLRNLETEDEGDQATE
jgi:hypothetical protein